jgi:hypothetical protein
MRVNEVMEKLLPYLLDYAEEITKSKEPERVKAFWIKIAWEVETCAEATEVFPDMTICPVCMACGCEGAILHRQRASILN